MNKRVATIPSTVTKGEELVVVPRREYEELLMWREVVRLVKPTAQEKRAIREGRKEVKEGKYFTLQQFKDELVR